MGTRKWIYFHLAMDCTQIVDPDTCQPAYFVIMLQTMGIVAAIEKGIMWLSHGAHGMVTLRNKPDHRDAARKTLHAWPLLSLA